MYSTTLSCSQGNIEQNPAENYSGEEIFKALFFLEGDLVNEIPSLNKIKVEREIMLENPIFVSTISNNITQKQKSELKNAQILQTQDLMNSVKEINPKIFKELKEAILSRNPDLVKEKLKKSAIVVKTALFQNKEFKDGIKLIEDAKNNAGIDPKNYDFEKQSELERYNEDMISFIKSNEKYNKMAEEEVLALAIVFLVTVAVLVAFVAYLAVAVGGEVAVFIANFLWIYNIAWWEDSKISNDNSVNYQLGYNQLISDLITAND